MGDTPRPDPAADLARQLLRRHERLKSERSVWETHWQTLAELVRPLRAEFNTTRTPGETRADRIYDGTAPLASENLAAGLWGMVTNAANQWFALKTEDEDLNDFDPVRDWLDDVTRRMRSLFAGRGGQFYTRVFELYHDLGVFGTAVFYSEEDPATGQVHFSARPLSECFVAEDDRGRIDTVFRAFTLTARQAAQMFGRDACGEKVAKALDKEPDRRWPYLHAVLPNEAWTPGRLGADGKPVLSVYISVEDRNVCRRGGFDEFPFQVPRWATASGEVYGRAPAMLALPDVKMVNAMSRETIVAAQKATNPPLLMHDDGVRTALRNRPGGVTYGAITPEGRPLVQPLISGARPDVGLEMQEQRRAAIRDAFYFSLMQLVGAPNMTATEVLQRQEEKLRLMGPHLGRLQGEFLDPLIDRVFAVMLRQSEPAWRNGLDGVLPLPPEALVGADIRVEYVSPLAKAQMAADGQAIIRTVESLMPLAQFDPGVLDNLDADAAARALANAWGAPAKIVRDPREVAQIRQQRQAAQTIEQGAHLGEQTAGIVEKVARAGQAARTPSPSVPGGAGDA